MADRLYMKADAIKFGWEKVTKNIGFFIGISLTVLLVNALPRISDAIWGPSIVLGLVFFLIKCFIDLGVIKISLNFTDNLSSKYDDLFTGMSPVVKYVKYIAAIILFIVLVTIGLILLVVPGVILGVRFMFFGALIVDKGLNPIEALKKSFEITKGKTWDLFLFTILLLLVNLLGLLCLGVGLVITLPLASIATMDVYRKLDKAVAA